MNADVVHSQFFQLTGTANRIGNREQIHHYLHAILARRPKCILDGGVVGCCEQGHYICPGLGRHLYLHGTGVDGFHISYNLRPGKGFLHLAHRVHALALDEGCSGLDPVRSTKDGLFGYLDRSI